MIRFILVLGCAVAMAQDAVRIRVDAGAPGPPFRHSWAFFGYDEPNYTYTKNGQKLLRELSTLSPVPVFIRAHNLLTTGDGTHALKWGSTNAYTEDASGNPVYDWKILDQIFDTFRDTGVKPLVEIGFMPKALSTKPEPYQHQFPKTPIQAGWAYPPKDYKKWADLVHAWVRHCVERYGQQTVEGWYWEVWNEPDIMYWQSTREEYEKLYDYASDALKRALPTARIGGPHTTGPVGDKAAAFLREFLEHCARGTNHATGKKGSPIDYIAFHPKGQPQVVEGHVRMGIARQLKSIDRGFEIVASFPEFKSTPIILGESDPEGCAACGVRTHPQNGYRNGPLYGVYSAVSTDRTMELARKHGVNLEGMVTWAFLFEDQPYFDGFRTLASNGVDKPVLNVFRMLGQMGGSHVAVESSGRIPVSAILESGVREKPEISALATRDGNTVSVLVWNYHDDDLPAEASPVSLAVESLPMRGRVRVEHFRMDGQHSNAYRVWKEMGSPQSPTAEQYKKLEESGRLEMLDSPAWKTTDGGVAKLDFSLPRQGVSLVRLSW
ncbi:MAG: beta-xylosidase [Bryobacteraceae bacterium]